MSRRKTKSRGACVFCGQRRVVTRDHIPPSCLFGKKGNLPSDLITVPACKRCNLQTSGDDEYLRLVLAASEEASGHPTAQTLLSPISRSLNRPEGPGFANLVFDSLTTVNAYTRSGIYFGAMPALRVDRARLTRIVEKVIRGLFFEEYKKRLPNSHKVVSLFVNPMRREVPRDEFEMWRHHVRELLVGGREREVGRRVLVYRCNRSPDHVFWTVWALTFYGNLHFVAFTNTLRQLEKAGVRQFLH